MRFPSFASCRGSSPSLIAAGLLVAARRARRRCCTRGSRAFLVIGRRRRSSDFWRWEYDYGHDLDFEHAIIKVPGMTYQPPLIGPKQLLNFTACRGRTSGGWLAFAALGARDRRGDRGAPCSESVGCVACGVSRSARSSRQRSRGGGPWSRASGERPGRGHSSRRGRVARTDRCATCVTRWRIVARGGTHHRARGNLP